jgi:hypothetical protein
MKSGKWLLLCLVAINGLLVAANFAIGSLLIAIPGTLAGVILPLVALKVTRVI